jgi:asparagine synthase (glutamine-hydrolysing)
MLFYVAFVWNSSDAEANAESGSMRRRLRETHPDWFTVLDKPGLVVSCSAPSGVRSTGNENVYVVPYGRGVVLGTLFPRTYADSYAEPSAPASVSFSEHDAENLNNTAGRNLMDEYWGSYVAFLRADRGHSAWILRDPAGRIPCQSTRVGSVDLYFVRVTDIEPLQEIRRTVNQKFLRIHLMLGATSERDTGINEIESLLPGECAEHTATTRNRTFYWDPTRHAAQDPITDEQAAVDLTRRTVIACTHAWASRFEGVLLSLSGGLDSSILAACLASAPSRPRVECRNFFAPNPNSDERVYARLVANRHGLPLAEEDAGVGYDLSPMTRIPRALLPVGSLVDLDYWRADAERQRARGLSASFNGTGGDELFYRGGPIPGAVDHAWTHGLSRSLFGAALDDSVLDNVSIWHTLRLAWHYGIRKRRWHISQLVPLAQYPLLTQETRALSLSDRSVWHPLYQSTPNLPPAKLLQALLVTRGSGGCHIPVSSPNALTQISPLNSQPFMELSLRIPIYLLRTGGRDRAIARKAFAPLLPTQIVNRRSKAFADSQNQVIIAQNIRLVREMLLDGCMVRNGFLDRKRLESVLMGDLTSVRSEINEITRYFNIETWWQRWAA